MQIKGLSSKIAYLLLFFILPGCFRTCCFPAVMYELLHETPFCFILPSAIQSSVNNELFDALLWAVTGRQHGAQQQAKNNKQWRRGHSDDTVKRDSFLHPLLFSLLYFNTYINKHLLSPQHSLLTEIMGGWNEMDWKRPKTSNLMLKSRTGHIFVVSKNMC